MHRSPVPTIAAVLAVGWLVAECTESAPAAALLAAAIPAIVAALALRRRPRPLRGRLAAFLAAMALLVGAAEGVLFLVPSGSPMTLVVQLSIVVLLAPAVPVVYALTFPSNGRSRR